MFGDLDLVASRYIGQAGPLQGKPVTYTRPLLWALLRVVPWLALFAILSAAPNRNRNAWKVLIPVAVLYPVVLAFEWVVISVTGPEILVFTDPLRFLIVGLAILWAASHYLKLLRPAYAILTALALLVATGAVGMCAYGYLPPSNEAWLCIAIYGISVVSVLAACAISTHRIRRTDVTHSLVPWLLLVPACLLPFTIIPIAVISAGTAFRNTGELIMAFAMLTAMGAGMGAVLYILLLPFAALTFHNQFYRDRMSALLRGPSPPANAYD